MRDPKKQEELGNISGVKLMALDVTDHREIEIVAEQVVASGGVDVGVQQRWLWSRGSARRVYGRTDSRRTPL